MEHKVFEFAGNGYRGDDGEDAKEAVYVYGHAKYEVNDPDKDEFRQKHNEPDREKPQKAVECATAVFDKIEHASLEGKRVIRQHLQYKRCQKDGRKAIGLHNSGVIIEKPKRSGVYERADKQFFE